MYTNYYEKDCLVERANLRNYRLSVTDVTRSNWRRTLATVDCRVGYILNRIHKYHVWPIAFLDKWIIQ